MGEEEILEAVVVEEASWAWVRRTKRRKPMSRLSGLVGGGEIRGGGAGTGATGKAGKVELPTPAVSVLGEVPIWMTCRVRPLEVLRVLPRVESREDMGMESEKRAGAAAVAAVVAGEVEAEEQGGRAMEE